MFHVHCKLPNASTEINGVPFTVLKPAEHEGDIVHVRTTDPVPGEVASQFNDIPGYEIEPAGEREPGAPIGNPAPPEGRRGPGRPSKAELQARAEAQAQGVVEKAGPEADGDDRPTGANDASEEASAASALAAAGQG